MFSRNARDLARVQMRTAYDCLTDECQLESGSWKRTSHHSLHQFIHVDGQSLSLAFLLKSGCYCQHKYTSNLNHFRKTLTWCKQLINQNVEHSCNRL